MLNKDSVLLGILIGLVLPPAFFGLLYVVSLLIDPISSWGRFVSVHNLMLASIFINLLPLRYYLVSLKKDRTGRAILMVTFLMMVIFFIFNRYMI